MKKTDAGIRGTFGGKRNYKCYDIKSKFNDDYNESMKFLTSIPHNLRDVENYNVNSELKNNL